MEQHRRVGVLQALAGALVLVFVCSAGSALADRGPAVSNGGQMRTVVEIKGKKRSVPLPLRHTEVDAEVAGVVASVKVTQHFHNPLDRPIEAVYVFPLPHRAAVHAMTITVGKRVIEGQVKKRAEAKKIYNRAKRQGKTAALLDQERPNIFTQSVANIMPGERIKVSIRYVEDLVPEKGLYEFVFPMVVGPRYIGGGSVTGTKKGGGWGKDSDRIPDASRITPKLLKKGRRPGHDIALRLTINGGVMIQNLRVVTHQAYVDRRGSVAQVVLDKRDTIPNKDFVVRYQLAGAQPEVAVLASRDARGGHFLLMVQPKARMKAADIAPREYVFAVDNSGSMSGFPVQQAKALVSKSLKNLKPSDTFQIIKFAGSPDQFAPRAVSASPANVERGIAYVGKMYGGGGTEFIPALRAALTARKDPQRARIVLFITDGYIGYENEVLRFLRKNIKGINVFALGIGSSVNRHLIDGMARIGHGAPFILTNAEKASAMVETIFSTISRPALTNISLSWDGVKVADQTPAAIPDLFGERPVVLAGRYNAGGRAVVTVRGMLAGRRFERKVTVDLPNSPGQKNAAVPYLWARKRIAEWMDIYATEPDEKKLMEKRVTKTALAYHLMSKFTSMVAVDKKVRNPGGEQKRVDQPVPLPQGVSSKAARPGAYVKAANSGILGTLKATDPAAIFGRGTALGADADDALAGLIGNQIGEAYGVGGLGLKGTGRGGGGTGQGTIGIGSLGTIGKGGGGGTGVGYGRGFGRVRSRRARAPRVVAGKAMVTGALSKEIIRRIIRRHINEVKYCYQKELSANPKLKGKVTVRFIIRPDGRVVGVKVVSTTLNHKRVERCLTRAIKRWLFPKPVGGGQVVVSYPFRFRTSN